MNTAKLAVNLCLRFKAAADQGYLAGLLHDFAREKTVQELLDLAAQDGQPITPAERQYPLLLHGRAAAMLLYHQLGITDQEILQAVKDHILGRPGMGVLSQIIFISDYLEPGREWINELERQKVLQKELVPLLLYVIEGCLKYLDTSHYPVMETTRNLYEEIRAQAW